MVKTKRLALQLLLLFILKSLVSLRALGSTVGTGLNPNSTHPFISYCADLASKPHSSEGRSLAVLKKSLGVSTCAALTQALLSRDSLCLAGTGLSDLSFLLHFHHFQKLDLSNNHIRGLKPLSHLAKLSHLWLGENAISDITPLSELLGLVVLGLEDNQISDLTALKACKALIAIDLSNNRLSEVATLLTLPQLDFIFLSYNSLQSLTSFSSAALAGKNREGLISQTTYIDRILAGSPHFDVLSLDHNPVALRPKNPTSCPLDSPYAAVRSLCSGL